MVSKAIFTLLGAIVLFNGYDARYLELIKDPAPYKDMDSALQALVERLKLLKLVETEHWVIDKEILGKGKTVMEKVLKDPKVLEVKSEQMKEILDRIREFVKNYEEYDKSGKSYGKELNELEDQYDSIVDQLDDEKNLIDIPEAKIISQSMKENGFEKLSESTKAQLKTFSDKLYAELEKYVDGLTEAERKKDTKILEFMKKLKEETDIEKRDDLVWTFFGLITLDDYMW